jgi:monoterpene epsilon-lactone hydrolase
MRFAERLNALREENIMSIGKRVSAVSSILVGALAACGGAAPVADGAKVSSINMQASATDHTSRTSVVTHPLDPGDAPVIAALRAMTRSAKGARQGIEARGPFDAFMGSVTPRDDVTFETGALGGIPGIWVNPANRRPDEAILHLHGGWFSLGSAKGYRNLVAQIAARAGAKAFIPDYGLAPEHPFPAATDDALACYRALAGSRVRRIAITGDSAGGNLALVLASRVTGETGSNSATLAGVVVLSPVTDLTLSGATYQTRADADPLFTRPQVAELVHSYLGSADAKQPLASPLFGRLSGMPPTRIHVGDDEVLLDDSLRFVERAVAAGVDARVDVWMGMPHGFPASVGRLKAASESLDAIGAFLTERLKAQASP